jgi:hypothetical protein
MWRAFSQGIAMNSLHSNRRNINDLPAKCSPFERSKRLGDAAEIAVQRHLARKGWVVVRAGGFNPGWDLLGTHPNMPGMRFSFEVKRDIEAERTGNFAIETAFKGLPSGISTTHADGWVLVVGVLAHLVRTAALRKWLAVNGSTLKETIGGDGNKSELLLVPIRRLTEIDGHVTRDLSALWPRE